MAYRLSFADPLPKTLRVTALEVLDDALGPDSSATVHGIAAPPTPGSRR